ncbi:DUF2868 domain-containing protein [Phycisphaera mikurensis]|uniref:DUF2868 domain-containing protein n=1 Tax=Phycisphaera mikurensis (strain NBRC 102666 / KCTC 22515 / FYK2301M01) TaxID=1142394 RepID=I0IJ37_PHYMF|nr:DUF2868 domain-containing protein [Phycisphaera mikurensis]MBB6443122.1 hypothetical protein [Phycisphaera mikurensis]BAM05275.1 hypothetical protein PSMK_31160 [Phycisphaera mikurensis NBRC 102666]
MGSPRFHLPDLLALAIQDRRDADRSRRELLERDRPAAAPEAPADLLAWIRRVDRGEARAQALSLTRTAAWGAGGAGVLLGVGVASAALAYDGSRPVNVLVATLALAVLPLGFSVLSAVAMAWPTRRGGPAEAEPSPLTPGRWLVGLAARVPWLPTLWREVLTRPLHGLASERVLLGPTLRWWALTLSQVFGLGYAGAGLATAALLIATRDLAFGWGSTLDLDPARLHAVAEAAVWFAPGLCPGPATVEATRTYRAAAFRGVVDPELFTAWWPWLLAVQAAYGLAPRLVLGGVALGRRRAAVAAAAQTWPGADAVIRRLREPRVQTRAEAAPGEALPPPAAAEPAGPEAPAAEAAVTLSWAEAPAPAGALPVGGRRSLAEDRAAVATAADRAASAGPAAAVRVDVKAWEPPVLEFTDFLADLRAALGRGRPVRVTPRIRGVAGDTEDVAVWAGRLAAAGDPWTRLDPPAPADLP